MCVCAYVRSVQEEKRRRDAQIKLKGRKGEKGG